MEKVIDVWLSLRLLELLANGIADGVEASFQNFALFFVIRSYGSLHDISHDFHDLVDILPRYFSDGEAKPHKFYHLFFLSGVRLCEIVIED